MKRKIAALLLSLSMLAVSVVPAGGADFTSGPETDIVQDAETAETETVPEMENADGTETAQETLQASENNYSEMSDVKKVNHCHFDKN